MKSQFKKLIAVAAAAAALCAAMTTPVYANNSNDTSFSITAQAPTFGIIPEGRPKEDATGTYVYFKTGDYYTGTYFRVYGSNYQNNTTDALNHNETRNGRAYIPVGSKMLIAQYVYEYGYEYAYLAATNTAERPKISKAEGLWSPDSVGSYTYAN